MYKVNDRVVYPLHGAGIVKEIVSQDSFDDGNMRDYYNLEIVSENLKIMVPVDKADDIGVRPVVDHETIEKMIETLHGKIDKMNKNWNKRYQNNMEVLKTGDIFEVANVVKNLTLLNRTKGLSTGEKKMMTNARNFLVSEIVLVEDVSKEEAAEMINNAIGEN